jgi:hypothetical protein
MIQHELLPFLAETKGGYKVHFIYSEHIQGKPLKSIQVIIEEGGMFRTYQCWQKGQCRHGHDRYSLVEQLVEPGQPYDHSKLAQQPFFTK